MELKRKNENPITGIFLFMVIFFMFMAYILLYTTTFILFDVDDSKKNINIEDIKGGEVLDYKNLASLSAKYESSGNCGTIANNPEDPGRKSYGAFQLASGRGSVTSFLIWLYEADRKIYDRLMEAKNTDGGYGTQFDNTWKQIANENMDHFYTLQYNYIKHSYFDVVVGYFQGKSIDFTKRTKTLQNVIWSLSVQHGTGGAISILSKMNLSLKEDLSGDKNLIKSIYEERRKVDIYFESSSSSIKNAVYSRFINEERDAMSMISKELGVN